MNVVLVGNYPNDGQESMLRFGDLLALELRGRGIQAERLCPSPVFGRLHRSANGAGKWLGYMDKFLIFPRKLRNRVRHLDQDSVVHICDHSNAVYTRALGNVPHLVTCHDLLAVRSALGEFPSQQTRASGKLYQKLILRGLNAAQRVACDSTATCRDVLRITKLAEHQVTLIHIGQNYSYAPLPIVDTEERLRGIIVKSSNGVTGKLKKGFILHVGGNQWYKNRLGVVQIYARLCENIAQPPTLVMAGKPLTPELKRSILRYRLQDRVVELNGVSNEDLRTLYCAAELLLFPSFAEGFGWPIIEAQACGCPVVIAKREPMNEIGGEAAVCFELESDTQLEDAPLTKCSAENAAKAVKETLLETSEARKSRVQKGGRNAARFSTARMVDAYIDLYKQLLHEA